MHICNACHSALPKTYNWKSEGNRVERLFWGKFRIEHGASFLYFTNGGIVQELLHELKYKGRQQIGTYLGELFADELKATPFVHADVIIPVPLHGDKLKIRSYNQCSSIAKAIALRLELNFREDLIERTNHNESQTKKSRFERWENVHRIFKAVDEEALIDKHVVLVDDVITTGSTMEACADAVLKVPGTRVSILTLALPMSV